MPRRASRGTGPSRDPIGTDHTPWPGQAPPREQPVRGHPARRRRALHEGDGQVAPHGVAGEHDARVRGAHAGPRPPRLEPHEHAVALDEPLLVHDVERGRLGVEPVELGPHPRAQVGLVGALGQRVRVQLDDRAAVRGVPPGRVVLEQLEHRDVVERPVAARAEERRAVRLHRARQPEPPDREGRGGPDAGHGAPATPRPGLVVAAEPGRGRHDPAQPDRVEREHDGIGREPLLLLVTGRAVQHRESRLADGRTTERTSRPVAHRDAEPVQVPAERRPQRGVVVVARHVEEQPLGRPDEVQVEHRDELGPGELARVGEEAAREHLERQVPGRLGEVQPVEHLGRADAVERGDTWRGSRRRAGPSAASTSTAGEPGQVEARAAGDEGREVRAAASAGSSRTSRRPPPARTSG